MHELKSLSMVDILPFLVGDPEATDPIKRGGHEGIEKAAEKLRNKKFKSMPSYDLLMGKIISR